MKKSIISRRKFLTRAGVAVAGAVAVPSTLKTLGGMGKGREGILSAWLQPAAEPHLRVVRVLSRKPGTYLLPLAKRPV